MKNKILVCGAGGFIGGHLIKKLKKNNSLVCVDVKPLNYWFQMFDENSNYSLDLKEYENCLKTTEGVDYVYNLACNMGGMGFIENNKAECMLSVLLNTNLLRACLKNKVKKYFFSSSACVYNASKQSKTFIPGLKESDAYPADPEDGYGWEKLFSERMCRHYSEDFGMITRVGRFHNVYGPHGTYDGGREKAPAAMCRKVIEAELTGKKDIVIWGDGEQTRSFMYIDDGVKGIIDIMYSDIEEPINLGSSEMVSINQLVDIVEDIAGMKLQREYDLDAPKGVRGRNSDNTLIKEYLDWEPSIPLKEGMQKTYVWIKEQMTNS